MKYLLTNSQTNNRKYDQEFAQLKDEINEAQVIHANGLDYKEFFLSKKEDDEVILCGGDGTLNYFINEIDGQKLECRVYLYPMGTGNDFYFDVCGNEPKHPVLLNDLIKDLPTVYVNGMKRKFINGIGFGIDGYCCEIGDKKKDKTDKPINYAAIAIKGLLFTYKKLKATVKVDGVEKTYKDVWLAPTMKGRYYGGGMMVTPEQDRNDSEKYVSSVVFRGFSRLGTLIVFPSIFKGKHVNHKKMVYINKGKEVEVTFDHPTALQIDGETVLNVTKYKVTSR